MGLSVIVIGGYVVTNFISGSNSAGRVPEDFIHARLEGALIAQTIVDLSRGSATDLGRISELDREKKFIEALDLTSRVLLNSREIRDEAVKLSEQMEKMTIALSSIRSTEARQAALESISNRLALITRLINYSASLGQLLDALEKRFTGAAEQDETVKALLENINAEINAINSFNEQASRAMERFDRFMSGQ